VQRSDCNEGQTADDVQNNFGVMLQSETLRNLLNSKIFVMTQYNLGST
jgi:hypothetical protein